MPFWKVKVTNLAQMYLYYKLSANRIRLSLLHALNDIKRCLILNCFLITWGFVANTTGLSSWQMDNRFSLSLLGSLVYFLPKTKIIFLFNHLKISVSTSYALNMTLWKKWTVMVNNSTNINQTNDHLSPQFIKHKKSHGI